MQKNPQNSSFDAQSNNKSAPKYFCCKSIVSKDYTKTPKPQIWPSDNIFAFEISIPISQNSPMRLVPSFVGAGHIYCLLQLVVCKKLAADDFNISVQAAFCQSMVKVTILCHCIYCFRISQCLCIIIFWSGFQACFVRWSFVPLLRRLEACQFAVAASTQPVSIWAVLPKGAYSVSSF